MKNGYEFRDKFNDRVISKHRTETGAIRSAIRWRKNFRKNHPYDGSYLPTELVIVRDGEDVGVIQYNEEYKYNNSRGFVLVALYDNE